MAVVQPHISINKLGEYIFATQAKKRSILKNLKFPSTFLAARYPEPQSAFMHYMADEQHNKIVFEKKKNQLSSKAVTSDWSKSKRQCCLEAIDHLVACTETILVTYLKYIAEKGLTKTDYETQLQGVTVHLKPDVLLIDAKTKEIKGFIKLIFSKSRNIDPQEGATVAATIKAHIEKQFKIKLKPDNCFALDVFHRRRFMSPKFLQTNKVKIKLACLEISAMWPTIND